MPIIQITINPEPDKERKAAILEEITRLSAVHMNKPPEDIMILWDYREIYMDFSFEPAAFIDFRFLNGFTMEGAAAICRGIARVFQTKAAISSSRIYIHFIRTGKSLSWRFVDGEPRCPAGESL